MANISLKALVDKGSNKVIFIEPGVDFVDILFSFLTIPMGTIIRLAHTHSDPVVIGCMNNLYASVENIDEQKFRSSIFKDMLLYPRNAADSHCQNLKINLDNARPTRYFICSGYKCVSCHNSDGRCSCSSVTCWYSRKLSVGTSTVGTVFLKGQTMVTVTDDLQVIPLSESTDFVFSELGVMDADATEELTINIGNDEILNLLTSSLVSKTVLTETLLKHKREPKSSSAILNQAIHIQSQMFGDTMNDEEGKISVKLVVSKSKKMICYAEAGEDFVNLLFSFLTLPLGFIVKNMKDTSLKGCIGHLYKTVQDFDENYMNSNYHKNMLLDPKLVPGFCYEDGLLGIEETSYYSLYDKLTSDRSLVPSEKLKVVHPKSCHDKDGSARGFLKEQTKFVVTDNLVVRPISRIYELRVLKDLNVAVTDVENQFVDVGKKEALHLLLASFLCDSALTNTFMSDLKEPKEEEE